MEWLRVVIDCAVALIGAVGGGIGLFFWKEHREIKKAEAHKSTTEARMEEVNLVEQILHKFETSVLSRMDTGEAVRKQEFHDLQVQIDKRFDVIEAEDKKQNEILRDVVEYLNGGFKQFEEQKKKKQAKSKKPA